MIFADRLYLLQ